MAKIPLRLDEIVDGDALRRELSALAEKRDGDSAPVRAASVRLLKEKLVAGRAIAEDMLRADGGGDAEVTARQALQLYVRKGNVVAARRVRSLLASPLAR